MKHTVFFAFLTAAAGLTAPAFAGQAGQGRGDQPQQSELRPMAQNISGRSVIMGELADMRSFHIKQTDQKHRLLKLSTDRGDVVIHVGAGSPPEELRLEQGDRVIAIGNKGRINGQPVLFARFIGETYIVGRIDADQQAQR